MPCLFFKIIFSLPKFTQEDTSLFSNLVFLIAQIQSLLNFLFVLLQAKHLFFCSGDVQNYRQYMSEFIWNNDRRPIVTNLLAE